MKAFQGIIFGSEKLLMGTADVLQTEPMNKQMIRGIVNESIKTVTLSCSPTSNFAVRSYNNQTEFN